MSPVSTPLSAEYGRLFGSGVRGRAHFGGCAHDRLLDAGIGHAAAEIAVHVRDYFVLGRIGVLGEQRRRLHDLPGLAVAALRNLLGDPRLLQRMVALGAEAFDGGDFLAGDVAERCLAGSHRFTVDVNGAGATQAGTAPELGAGHLQLFADGPEQRRVVRRLDGQTPPVDVKIRHGFFPCRCMMPLTAAIHVCRMVRHPPGRCQPCEENDRVPIWRQCKLELVEEK